MRNMVEIDKEKGIFICRDGRIVKVNNNGEEEIVK